MLCSVRNVQVTEENGKSDSASLYPAVPSTAVRNGECSNSMWQEEEECASFALEDLDLRYSKRDREKVEEGIRNQAVLQVIEEVAGEVYHAAYVDEMKKTMEFFSNQWGVDISGIMDE